MAAACIVTVSPQDECYQVRQVFAQKLHKGLSRLRLPLEYMAICALCAKDPVKERRAHARQCLVKNINVRREYLKQHAAVSGERGTRGSPGGGASPVSLSTPRAEQREASPFAFSLVQALGVVFAV